MSRNGLILARMCCAGIVLLISGTVLFADNAPVPTSGNDGLVPIKTSNGTSYVKSASQPDPLRNLPQPTSTDKYDPQRIFSHTSSLSNKSFSSDSIAISKSDSASNNKQAFAGKSYGNLTQADLMSSSPNGKYASSEADYGHHDSSLDKKYSTTTNSAGRDQTNPFAVSSPYQSQNAVMGDHQTNVYESSLSKQYVGPGAQHVPANVEVKDNVVISRLTDLPNRTLTVGEVKTLINHGFKPPEEGPLPGEGASSKALNDPNYKPEPSSDVPESTAPTPSARASNDDNKTDLLPSPGTIAQPPENTEPLPQAQH